MKYIHMNSQYIEDYRNDKALVSLYHRYTRDVFRFDLSQWEEAGWWTVNYIPHSLLINGNIAANISASMMDVQIMGQNIKAVQLGSVGVVKEFRGQGLSRLLMENVLEKYRDVSLIFLFANAKVLDYYPLFGFQRIDEIIPKINVSTCLRNTRPLHKITMDSPVISRLLRRRLEFSRIVDARGNESVYRYHLLYDFPDNIYYIDEFDAVFIAEYEGCRADLFDILTASPIRFEQLQEHICLPQTESVYFHFTPDWLTGQYEENKNCGDTLFIRGNFPERIPPFHFPDTAHT